MAQIESLLKRYGIRPDENELRQIFTHHSFREDKNNSRLVFLGKDCFRGILCRYVFENIPGTGMQLQHYLGNIFSEKALRTLFEKWKLRPLVRIDPNYKKNVPDEIFVYALLGYLIQNLDHETLEEFLKHFFIFPNDKYLPDNYKKRNHKEQLIHLCKLHFDLRPQFKSSVENDLQKVEVYLKDEIIGSHSSVSYKYAYKKAVKTAFKTLLERIEQIAQNDPVYIQNEKLRTKKLKAIEEAAKTERQEKHKKMVEDHSLRMAEKRKQDKLDAIEKDRRRKEAKRLAKERAERKVKINSIYREYTIEEIREMTPSKRRNLQDRGIIPEDMY